MHYNGIRNRILLWGDSNIKMQKEHPDGCPGVFCFFMIMEAGVSDDTKYTLKNANCA